MTKLIQHLENLQRLDIISTVKNQLDTEFSFKHVFTQESVYSSLLRSDRRQLHQQVGEAMEELLSESPGNGETSLLLAYHFEQSGDKIRALKYLRHSADSARKAFANQEAKALYGRALALVNQEEFDTRWELLVLQEQILDRLGERDQQADVLIQMQTLAEIMQDDERLSITHNRRATYFDKISEYQAAAEAASVGLRVARRSGNSHLEAESLNLLALAAWRRFDYPEVQEWATQALDALKVVGDPTMRIDSLFHLGKSTYRMGKYDLALNYCTAAQKLTHTTDNRDGEATSHLILGWIYQRLGDYDRAVEHFEKKLAVRTTIGDRYGQATALSHLGWVAYNQHNPQAGVDYCRQALNISHNVNDRENEAYALSGLGLNYEQMGQLEVAEENYQAALALHKEIGATTLVIFDQAGLARIALARDDHETARSYISTVSDWVLSGNAQKFWDPWIIYRSSYQVLTALGDIETAHTILNEAHTILHQRANEISDESLRRCFLEKVDVNRELEEVWYSLSQISN